LIKKTLEMFLDIVSISVLFFFSLWIITFIIKSVLNSPDMLPFIIITPIIVWAFYRVISKSL